MSLRIGIMLRAIDEKGGIGVYTRNITEELLALDRSNRYTLFYRNPANLGRFAHFDHAEERLISAPNKALWDQAAIPLACRKEKLDVLFHPKFTVPLAAPCKTVMVLHGAGWFMPEFSGFWSKRDIRYVRAAMPVYCRSAAAVISVSQVTTDTFNRTFKLPPGKVQTVYFAPGRNFSPVSDPLELQRVREKYRLPEKFIFTLSGFDRGDRKNFIGILNAYRTFFGKSAHSLIVGGRDCHLFRQVYGIPEDGYGQQIHFPGWIDQADLPAIYTLADVFLYPSNVEAFPIPITEALACGKAIITSNANGLKELVAEAALLVDPSDHDAIAAALERVLLHDDVRADLERKALQRSAVFSWDRCARETLNILERSARNH